MDFFVFVTVPVNRLTNLNTSEIANKISARFVRKVHSELIITSISKRQGSIPFKSPSTAINF